MARFSLKWLFVLIAALAGLLGWINDHRRLSRELYDAKTTLSVQNDRIEAMINQMLKVYIKDVSATVGTSTYDRKNDKLTLSGGELSTVAAYTLAASRIPIIECQDVTIGPDAQDALRTLYDMAIEGKAHHYRLKPLYNNYMGFPGGRP